MSPAPSPHADRQLKAQSIRAEPHNRDRRPGRRSQGRQARRAGDGD